MLRIRATAQVYAANRTPADEKHPPQNATREEPPHLVTVGTTGGGTRCCRGLEGAGDLSGCCPLLVVRGLWLSSTVVLVASVGRHRDQARLGLGRQRDPARIRVQQRLPSTGGLVVVGGGVAVGLPRAERTSGIETWGMGAKG